MSIFQQIQSGTSYLTQLLNNQQLIAQTDHSIVTTKDYQISNPLPGVFLCEPVNGQHAELALVHSCAVHGNETAPIELCDELLSKLINEQYQGKNPILIIFGNLPAILNHTRFIEENMNRLFAGHHQGKEHPEAKRASELEQQVISFYDKYQRLTKVHLDLHTAIRDSAYKRFAIYPYQDIPRELPQIGKAILEAAAIEALLLGHKPASTFSYFSAKACGAISFTVELGKVKAFGDNKLEDFAAIRQLLKDLTSAKVQDFRESSNSIKVFHVVDEVLRHSEDEFKLNLPEDFANFSELPFGFKLTEDDKFSYLIKHQGAVVIFPNSAVPVGQRVGLIAVESNS